MSQTELLDSAATVIKADTDLAQRRRVLFLIDNLLGQGGAEGALLRMVRHLPDLGYDCTIATFDLSHDPKFLSLFPCPVHEFRVAKTYTLDGLRMGLRLRRFVGKNGFDIIHSMFPTSDVWGAPLAAFGRRTRIISSRRDMGIVRSRKHEIAYRLLAPWFDQVHAVSHAVRNISIEKDGLSPDKVTTIHNGVDVERILATPASVDLRKDLNLNPAGAVVITAVSKLWPVKGVDIFLRAAAVVLKSLPDTNFVIAGWDKTEHAAELRQLACELGIAPRVRFIGRVPSIISVMKASDIFCLLSRSEGLSNALLEAMTCGLPCVATSVGGNPEVVKDGDSGFLVPTEDVQLAADRILQLLKNPHLTKKLGAGSQRRVHSEFTVEHMVRRVAMLYDELLDVKRLG